MPEISLREYEFEIDQLIEEARYLEALAHVRHIISHYPRHLGAYYLLGKMLLEADQPNLAVDMFRRALNADPEHLKSRIGLGLAHEQRDDLSAAIWNLERAFELAPANADIADELRRIYGRRDGIEPDHIPISRAGLSRLYMRGNLSSRAVDELRNLLTKEPKRPDLLGALAEAYWRDGQIVQAAETCQRILDDMPYHRKANLLLGTLWLNSGQEEGQTYLNRSQEVDTDNTLAVELLGAASPLKLREVFMDRLVYDLDGIDVDQQAAWFKHLEAASVSVGISEAVPDMSESDVRLVDITAGLQSQIEIPDWLRELGSLEDGADQEGGLSWMSDMTLGEELVGRDTALEVSEPPAVEVENSEVVSSGVVESPDVVLASESTEGSADWLSEFVAEELDETAEDVPDWLEDITLETKDAVRTEQPVETVIESADQFVVNELEVDNTQVEPSEAESSELAFEDEVEETPDWLDAVAPPSIEETVEETEADVVIDVLTDAVPDVVADVVEITVMSVEDDTTEPDVDTREVLSSDEEYIEQDELEEIAEIPAGESAVEEKDAEGIPDWLQSIAPTAEEAMVLEPSDEIDVTSADLDWGDKILADTAADDVSQPESISQQEIPAEVPDWLQALAPATDEVTIGALSDEGEKESTELDWLEEITADLTTTETGVPLEETSGDVPDWLQSLAPTEPQATAMEPTGEVEAESTELDWLEVITADLDATESDIPLEESGDVPDWLQSLAPTEAQATAMEPTGEVEAESTEIDWLEAITADLDATESDIPLEESGNVPDWLQSLAPTEAQATPMESTGEVEAESTELDWLEAITADLDATESDLPLEESGGAPDWLQALAPSDPQTTIVESVGEDEVESTKLDWLEGITEIDADDTQRTQPLTMPLSDSAAEDIVVEDGSLDWLEKINTEAPSTAEDIPDWISQLQPISTEPDQFTLSEEEIPDLIAELDISVEDTTAELAADQIEAYEETDGITDDNVYESDSEIPPSQKQETQKEEEFFGRQAFGDEITEVTPTIDSTILAETTSGDIELMESVQEKEEQAGGLFGWDAFGESITEATSAPTETGEDVLSGDDALAWLESLTAGKEDELRAQTKMDSEARMAEILGRKPAPVQEEVVEELVEEIPEAVTSHLEPEPEVTLFEEPVDEVAELEPVAEAEEDVLSGDDALAWLESLTVGKEDELRAQTEMDSEARMAEILGRKPAPVQEEVVEELVEEIPEAVTSQLETESEVTLFEEPVDEVAELEPVAEAEEDVLSGDDALAWLESLTVGKEDELRVQTEMDSEARMAEILGRKPAPVQEEVVEELVEEIPEAVTSQLETESEVTLFEEPVDEVAELEPVAEAEEDVLSGDDALAWLESLTVGKEDELRAQTEMDSEARMAEILGRKPAPVQEEVVEELVEEIPEAVTSQLETESEVTLFEEPVDEVAELEPVAEADEDVLSGDDALAWLESLTVGKEDELRAQTEMDSETRMAEILGRKPAPVQEEGAEEPALAEGPALTEEPESVVVEAPVEEEPGMEPEAIAIEEPVAEADEPEMVVEAPAVEELEPEPEAITVEEPVAEADEPEMVVEAPAVEELEPEPEAITVEEPVAEADELEMVVEAPAVEELEPEPEAIAAEESVAEADEPEMVVEAPAVEDPEPEPEVMVVEEPVAEVDEPEMVVEAPAVEDPEPEPEVMVVEEPVAEVDGTTPDNIEEMRTHLKRKRSDHETRLKFSRALWSVGDIKEAMKHYGTLIKSGAKMGEIYEDLQEYLSTHPKDSDVLKTLGDAYMKDGDLDRALEIYNEAMNTL